MAAASSSSRSATAAGVLLAMVVAAVCLHGAAAQLCEDYYDDTCPDAYDIVKQVLMDAHQSDTRIFASLIRLHFHDCFVQGCDGSLLLDTVPGMQSEKESPPNNGSARGFPVVDAVKAALEDACPGVVSCADILAIAAEISVELSGGPSWGVLLGRLDGKTSDFNGSLDLPAPTDNLTVLQQKFSNLSLNDVDLVALSAPRKSLDHTHMYRGPHLRPGTMPVRHGPALQLQRHKHAGPDPGLVVPGVPVAEVPKERRP
ncbi:hypothetical protein PVAP13_9NG374828 [Panicum virgatum]|uniref:Plant heme peroxidase family profile domain-containing protein n=1 Tax=Panicum virgatum TaxID=38727 RepID=A0A8T0MP11_PANVG|nr:hypothetical protein PVAP13_9NG374828 [Panicum virgatum]